MKYECCDGAVFSATLLPNEIVVVTNVVQGNVTDAVDVDTGMAVDTQGAP